MTLEDYIEEITDYMERAYMSINVISGDPHLTYGNRIDIINANEDIKFSFNRIKNILNEAAERKE